MARRRACRRPLLRRVLPRGDGGRRGSLARRPRRRGHRAGRGRQARPPEPRRIPPPPACRPRVGSRRQPRGRPRRGAPRRAGRGECRRDPLAAPRAHQPGRRRHRPDALCSRRVRGRGDGPARAGTPPGRPRRAPPPHADGGPHPHAARRAHDVRAEGGGLADRRPRLVRRRVGGGPAGAGRRGRRHHGRHRRAGRRPRRPGRRGDGTLARAGHRVGPDRLDAVAHEPLVGHPPRRRRGRLHRRLGPDRHRRRDPQPSRDRRAVGRRARRVVDDASQGQPRPRHPRPPHRARQPRPRGDPARRGRRRRRRTPGGRLARRVGHLAHAAAPDRDRRRAGDRAAGQPAGACRSGWPRRSTPRATPYAPSRPRWPS